MAKSKSYRYIIDRLSAEKGEVIKKALQKIPEIKSITVDVTSGTLDLLAEKDAETEVKLACDIAGATFRVKISTKRSLFG